MKDRTGNTAGRKARLAVVGHDEVVSAARAAFADQGQVLLPILELVENARASIDELMNGAARGFVVGHLLQRHGRPGHGAGELASSLGIALAHRHRVVHREPAEVPPAEQARHGEHVLPVRCGLEDLLLDPLAVQEHALLVIFAADRHGTLGGCMR